MSAPERDPVLEAMPLGYIALDRDWRITYVNTAGEAVVGDLLLGVDPALPRREHSLVLERGSTVLLYTDGLVERRDVDIDTGLARLAEAVTALAGYPLDELADEVIERLVHGRPDDDVALVALRLDR